MKYLVLRSDSITDKGTVESFFDTYQEALGYRLACENITKQLDSYFYRVGAKFQIYRMSDGSEK